MEAQGYKFKDKVMFQDNMSATKMEKNGRNSCTGNSRHYFFVKDRLDKKEFRLEYCPTGDIIADYFTKPLQGALFTKFTAVIMGWEHIDSISTLRNKERVAEHVFPCEEKEVKNTVKKSYADAVKTNPHVNNAAQHMASSGAKTAIQHAEQAPINHSF